MLNTSTSLTFDGNEEFCFNMNLYIKLQKPVFEVFILFLSASCVPLIVVRQYIH